MKTTEFIKRLTDHQLEIGFIILGTFFNKNEYINSQNDAFKEIAEEGKLALSEHKIVLSNEFTVRQIQALMKIEMFNRGIE